MFWVTSVWVTRQSQTLYSGVISPILCAKQCFGPFTSVFCFGAVTRFRRISSVSPTCTPRRLGTCTVFPQLCSVEPPSKLPPFPHTRAHLLWRFSIFHRPATPYQRGIHGYGRATGQPESGRAITAAAYAPVRVRDGQEQNLGVDSGSFSYRYPEDEGAAQPLGMVCSRCNRRCASVTRAHHRPHHD